MGDRGKRESGTAAVSSRTVSLLVEKIEKAVNNSGSFPKEFPELKALKEKCCDVNVCTAFCACQGVVYLVKKKILSGTKTMSLLISLLPSITHYTPLVISIGNVLFSIAEEEIYVTGKYNCQYNFTDRSHPFVIIMKHDSGKYWNAVYAYIQLILQENNNEMTFSSKINVLRSFFFYIFCDPTDNSLPYKNDLFSLLIEHVDKEEAKKLIIQGLTWQKIDLNFCWLIRKIVRSLIKSPEGENRLILSAMTPLVAYVVKWLVINAQNPVLWIDLVWDCLKIDDAGAGCVLFILSDVLLDAPSLFVNQLVELCKKIIFSLSCNKYTVQKFAAVSLIWLVNPSTLAEPVFNKLDTIFKYLHIKRKKGEWIKKKDTTIENPYCEILWNSYEEVKIAVEMTEMSESWTEETSPLNWLKKLNASNNSKMETNLWTFVSGMLLYECDEEILEMSRQLLLTSSNGDGQLSFNLLCLIFFKLCREVEPRRQLNCLRSLVEIGIAKENVPFIIGIFETLRNGQGKLMLPVVIDMYLKLWKANNRFYTPLHKTLFSSREKSWEINVMKTVALKEICRLSPETYGKSLVPKLNEILNDCDDCSSSVAIEAVVELCKASVADITGAWKALKPKLGRDNRKKIVISLCLLFREVPALKNSGPERDLLTTDIVPRLWSYAFSSDMEVVKAALKALAKFGTESYGPKLLPESLKSDLEVPKQYLKQFGEVSRTELLDQLDYVPGEVWVEVIQRIDPEASKDVIVMIRSMIEEELNSLPRRFFCNPEEAPEPVNYNSLPHSSICRALVCHIKKHLDSLEDVGQVLPVSVIESLRILGGDYAKCLPVLNWSFLGKFFYLGEDCRKCSLTILAKQGTASKAGRNVFENYIADNAEKLDDINDFIYLFDALPYVCNSLSANTLRQFLNKTVKTSLIHSLKSETDHFEVVLKNVKVALESKLVPDPRKALLLSQLQNILPHIPPDHATMEKYAAFCADISARTVESLTSPSSWPKVTSDKIRRSIRILKMAALHPESTKPLGRFNECIDAALNLPSEHNFIIDTITEVLRKKKSLNHSTWLTELMWRIQSSTSSVDTTETMKVTLFLLDLFGACTITLSGCDSFLSDFKGDSVRKAVLRFFPVSLHRLLELPDYSELSEKMIKWIHEFSKWKNLPQKYVNTFEKSVLLLRNNKFCSEKNKWLHLFYLPAKNCCIK